MALCSTVHVVSVAAILMPRLLHDSYIAFDSLMDIINWNSSVRDELKMDVKLCRSPFGTPAELACK